MLTPNNFQLTLSGAGIVKKNEEVTEKFMIVIIKINVRLIAFWNLQVFFFRLMLRKLQILPLS